MNYFFVTCVRVYIKLQMLVLFFVIYASECICMYFFTRCLLHVPEVAQASGGSRREEAIPNELYPDEGTHDDGPRPEENSDSDPDQPEPAQENMEDGSFPKLSARQKKWMDLRAKMVLND
jgi:hypothetical protein